MAHLWRVTRWQPSSLASDFSKPCLTDPDRVAWALLVGGARVEEDTVDRTTEHVGTADLTRGIMGGGVEPNEA